MIVIHHEGHGFLRPAPPTGPRPGPQVAHCRAACSSLENEPCYAIGPRGWPSPFDRYRPIAKPRVYQGVVRPNFVTPGPPFRRNRRIRSRAALRYAPGRQSRQYRCAGLVGANRPPHRWQARPPRAASQLRTTTAGSVASSTASTCSVVSHARPSACCAFTSRGCTVAMACRCPGRQQHCSHQAPSGSPATFARRGDLPGVRGDAIVAIGSSLLRAVGACNVGGLRVGSVVHPTASGKPAGMATRAGLRSPAGRPDRLTWRPPACSIPGAAWAGEEDHREGAAPAVPSAGRA